MSHPIQGAASQRRGDRRPLGPSLPPGRVRCQVPDHRPRRWQTNVCSY